VDIRIFLIDSEISELLVSYQEYLAKSVGKRGEKLLMAEQVRSYQKKFIINLVKLMNCSGVLRNILASQWVSKEHNL
jgi:hypothetical protein